MALNLLWAIRLGVAAFLALGWILDDRWPGGGARLACLDLALERLVARDGADRPDPAIRRAGGRGFDRGPVVLREGEVIALDPFQTSSGEQSRSSSVLRVSLPALPVDQYLIRWSTTTAGDFHQVSGTVAFAVGLPVQAGFSPAGEPPIAPVVESLLRLAVMLALVGAIGGGALLARQSSVLVDRPGASRESARRYATVRAAWSRRHGRARGLHAAARGDLAVRSSACRTGGRGCRSGRGRGHDGSATRGTAGVRAAVERVDRAGRCRVGHRCSRPWRRTVGLPASGRRDRAGPRAGHLRLGRRAGREMVLVIPALRAGEGAWLPRVLVGFAGAAAPALVVAVVSGLLLASGLVLSTHALTGSSRRAAPPGEAGPRRPRRRPGTAHLRGRPSGPPRSRRSPRCLASPGGRGVGAGWRRPPRHRPGDRLVPHRSWLPTGGGDTASGPAQCAGRQPARDRATVLGDADDRRRATGRHRHPSSGPRSDHIGGGAGRRPGCPGGREGRRDPSGGSRRSRSPPDPTRPSLIVHRAGQPDAVATLVGPFAPIIQTGPGGRSLRAAFFGLAALVSAMAAAVTFGLVARRRTD